MKNSYVVAIIGVTLLLGLGFVWWNFTNAPKTVIAADQALNEHYWIAPDTLRLPDNDSGRLIKYGRDLIVRTAYYYGPKGKIKQNHINGMNCQNCHLEAGTRVWGNNLSGVIGIYPKYRDILGAKESAVERVEDCFTRSLAGKRIDTSSHEMKAIIAYMTWLSSNLKPGEKPKGVNLRTPEFLTRAADPEKGKMVFINRCQTCHQADGQGMMDADKVGYIYPPLWGPHAYNIGASFFRLERFAAFVRDNMPNGATYLSPRLTDEEAWDVAAYVNSQEHPFVDVKHDWPEMASKPYDNPHGPYADSFPVLQHKYGPFAAIKEWREKNKKRS